MKLYVRYYHKLRQVAGTDGETVEVIPAHAGGSPATIASLVEELVRRYPAFAELVPALCFALNGEFADRSACLGEGDTVDIMPPFSGG